MKVWARDKFISITLQQMRELSESDAIRLRQLVGEILTSHTGYLGFPFANVSTEKDYQEALGRLFTTKTVNDFDVNTSLILQDYKKVISNDLELIAVNVAAAYMKSIANIATFRKKRKTPSQEKMRKYDFFSKLALNAIVEFQSDPGVFFDAM